LRINRLPVQLAVQFVRFFWKAGVDNKPGNKSKITRPVVFPLKLDLYDFCTDELKKQLTPVRTRIRAAEDKRLGVAVRVVCVSSACLTKHSACSSQTEQDSKKAKSSSDATTSSTAAAGDDAMAVDDNDFESRQFRLFLVVVVVVVVYSFFVW
jgi:ubiquitin carboxyl-terminal hydrolase 14